MQISRTTLIGHSKHTHTHTYYLWVGCSLSIFLYVVSINYCFYDLIRALGHQKHLYRFLGDSLSNLYSNWVEKLWEIIQWFQPVETEV
jgi:hypothetical protein